VSNGLSDVARLREFYEEEQSVSPLQGPTHFFTHDLLFTMKKESVPAYKTSITIYQTTRRHIPGDSDLHTDRCENLRSPTYRDFVRCNNTSQVRGRVREVPGYILSSKASQSNRGLS
jgi:hypothetical protein